ncbi:hypothetical protein D3C81_1906830 [compost metagenome]
MPGGGIKRLENRVRCFWIVFAKNTDDFCKLVHQLGLVLQTASRVDDEHVAACILCLLPCIIGKTCRIGAEFA